jgi:hypothetical protein
MQVVNESLRSDGQERSAQVGVRSCDIYGKVRHNARNCQVVIETSTEEYSK